MKKYFRLVKNIGFFGLVSFVNKLIAFLLLPIYTAYLSTEEYAVVDLTIVIQSLVWPLFSMCVCDALLRFGFEKGIDHSKLYSLSLAIAVPGLIAASVLLLKLNFDEMLFSYRLWVASYYVVVSINSLNSFFARVTDRIALITKVSILTTVIIALFSIVFIKVFNLGATGYFASLVLGNLFSVIAYFVFGNYKSYITYIGKPDIVIAKKMLAYSIPMIPNAIFWWINSSLDKFCIASIIGLSAVGIYSAAGKMSSVLSIITAVFGQAWNISAFEEYRNKGSSLFFANIYLCFRLLCTLLSIAIILLNPIISCFLLSEDFASAQFLVPMLVLAFFYSAMNMFFGSVFTAYKKTNLLLWTTGTGALANIILNYIFINAMNVIGAAIATVISNILVFLFRRHIVRKMVRIKTIGRFEMAEGTVLILTALSATFLADGYLQYACGSLGILIALLEIVYFRRNSLPDKDVML